MLSSPKGVELNVFDDFCPLRHVFKPSSPKGIFFFFRAFFSLRHAFKFEEVESNVFDDFFPSKTMRKSQKG